VSARGSGRKKRGLPKSKYARRRLRRKGGPLWDEETTRVAKYARNNRRFGNPKSD
jgi:uncharacterized protein (DUF2384 family)